jgi:hypothetical protein
MKKMSALITLLMALSATGAAYAHPDHDDAPPVIYQVDHAITKDGARFLVTLNGEKVATAGATGKLLLTKDGKKTEVALKPAGDNVMVTAAPTKFVRGAQARVMITLPDVAMATTDFVVK